MKKIIKLTENDFYNIIKENIYNILKETSYQIDDATNTHYAIHKPTNKIVFSWDYSDVDPEDLRQFKNDYFTIDLKELVGVNPKECTILNRKSCIKRGIDPSDNNNWCSDNELKQLYTDYSINENIILKKNLNEGYYGDEYYELTLDELDYENQNLYDYLEQNNLLDEKIEINLKFHEVPYSKVDYDTPPSGGYAEMDDYSIDLSDNLKNSLPKEILSELMKEIEIYISRNEENWSINAYENFNDDSYFEDDRYDEWRELNR